MRAAVRLGRIGGVEIIADVSVLIVAGLLGWVHAVAADGLGAGVWAGALGVVVAVGYVGSLVAHEALHSRVARYRKLTPRRIRLLVFGGYTAIDDRGLQPTDEFWIALAGPVASLVIGGGLWALSLAVGFNDAVAETLRLLGTLNLVVSFFNLLPGLPLDGGRALHAVLWKTSGDRVGAARNSTIAGRILGLVAAGIGIFMLIVANDLGGIFLLLLGWFLYQSATAAGKREELLARSAGSTAGDIMRPSPDAVPGPMRVAEITALFQSGPTMRSLPVEVEGRVTGIIGQAEIDRLAPGRRELGRAATVMTPIGPDDLIDADAPIDAVVAKLSSRDRLVVVENGVAVGVIEARDIEDSLT